MNISNGQIRLATQNDFEAIHQIAQTAYSVYLPRMDRKPYPMLDDYAAHIEHDNAHVLEQDGEIRGYIVLLPKNDELLLESIAVHPSVQGRGFGAALLRFAEYYAKANGFSRISLYTNAAMTENISLYQHMGYVLTRRGIENGYSRVFFEKNISGGNPDI